MDQHEDVRQEPGLAGQPDIPKHWISVPQASQLVAEAGLPRNKRTVRRYCERGELECLKTENALHQPQYFIDPESIREYIAQQKTLPSHRLDTSGQDRFEPGSPGTTPIDAAAAGHGQGQPAKPGHDRPGPAAQAGALQKHVDFLEKQISEKDAQLERKDGQITRLNQTLDNQITQYHEIASMMGNVGIVLGQKVPQLEAEAVKESVSTSVHAHTNPHDDQKGDSSTSSVPQNDVQ